MTNRMNIHIVAVVVAVVMIVGVSAEVFASGVKPGPTSNTSTSISTSTTVTSAAITCSTTSTGNTNSSVGTIDITSPAGALSVFVGDTYNISGFVIPNPTHQDSVLIQVYQVCSPVDLDANTVTVSPGGTFQWIATVGATWTTGYYTITAVDTYGAIGSTTIYVGCNY